MDPNETLKKVFDCLCDHQTGDEIDYLCLDLYQWIQKGGFEPDWSEYPLATSYYNCRKVHMDRGEF